MFLQKSYSYKNYGQCKWELSANLKGKPEDYGQSNWELSVYLKDIPENSGQLGSAHNPGELWVCLRDPAELLSASPNQGIETCWIIFYVLYV